MQNQSNRLLKHTLQPGEYGCGAQALPERSLVLRYISRDRFGAGMATLIFQDSQQGSQGWGRTPDVAHANVKVVDLGYEIVDLLGHNMAPSGLRFEGHFLLCPLCRHDCPLLNELCQPLLCMKRPGYKPGRCSSCYCVGKRLRVSCRDAGSCEENGTSSRNRELCLVRC